MDPEITGYSIKRNNSTLVYSRRTSRRTGEMRVENVFPVGNDQGAEEIIYEQLRRQIVELVINDISRNHERR